MIANENKHLKRVDKEDGTQIIVYNLHWLRYCVFKSLVHTTSNVLFLNKCSEKQCHRNSTKERERGMITCENKKHLSKTKQNNKFQAIER